MIANNVTNSVIWRKKTEFTHAVQHHNAMWTCNSHRNVTVSENGILQNFIENSNFYLGIYFTISFFNNGDKNFK